MNKLKIPKVEEEVIYGLLGPFKKYYVTVGNQKIEVPTDGEWKQIPFMLKFEQEKRTYGKYEYQVDSPEVGLAITDMCNGYGSGTSTSYVITEIFFNGKGKVNGFRAAKVYLFEKDSETEGIALVNMNNVHSYDLAKGK